jgi:hypothetical protein
MLTGPRLRQVALVARDGDQVAGQLRRAFGWGQPFHDPGVRQFGLANAVFAVADTFVEVVAPARPDTTAGRYLERRGGDGGYMAIFQVPDLAAARRRLASLGARVVWTADLPDMAATHLHPKDVPGAIMSLDWAAPEESWRWAGPSWTGHAPEHAPGGVTGLTIEVSDPPAAARRWEAVLGIRASGGHPAETVLPDSGQRLRFVPAAAGHGEGITAVTIAGLPGGPQTIGGVQFASGLQPRHPPRQQSADEPEDRNEQAHDEHDPVALPQGQHAQRDQKHEVDDPQDPTHVGSSPFSRVGGPGCVPGR